MTYLLLLADGFEEIEALGTADLLRRAGLDVTLCAINRGPDAGGTVVRGAHGVRVMADVSLADINPDGYDAIILPGGMTGTQNLAADDRVIELLRKADADGRSPHRPHPRDLHGR